MSSLRDIRKRIKSVKNTRQITKAMKMVAAAKLRKAQENATNARSYAESLMKLLDMALASEGVKVTHPLLERRPVDKVELLLVTSDRGLAGAYNANVCRQALKFIRTHREVQVTTIGKKGGEFLRAKGIFVRKDWPGLYGRMSYEVAEKVAEELSSRFLSQAIDAVYVACTRFKSALAQEPHIVQFLPATPDGTSDAQLVPGRLLFEPNAQQFVECLLSRVAGASVFRILLESLASEYGARMTAMENATRAAGDMIDSLTLAYNRTRQASITKELMEIVSGAEALKG